MLEVPRTASPGERRVGGCVICGGVPRGEGLQLHGRPRGEGLRGAAVHVATLRGAAVHVGALRVTASAEVPRAAHAARPESVPPRGALPPRCGEARGEARGEGGT